MEAIKKMEQLTLEFKRGAKGFELPQANGDWVMLREEGYSPVQMLASAIGACGGYVYESVLTNSKIPFEIERGTVTYTRSATKKAEPLENVTLVFYAKIPAEYQERATRALKLINPNCPVMQSLDPAIKVTEEVVFL